MEKNNNSEKIIASESPPAEIDQLNFLQVLSNQPVLQDLRQGSPTDNLLQAGDVFLPLNSGGIIKLVSSLTPARIESIPTNYQTTPNQTNLED